MHVVSYPVVLANHGVLLGPNMGEKSNPESHCSDAAQAYPATRTAEVVLLTQKMISERKFWPTQFRHEIVYQSSESNGSPSIRLSLGAA